MDNDTTFLADTSLEQARTPPAWWYRSLDRLEVEKVNVLAGNWQVVAHADEVKAKGEFASGCAGGEPWVIVRDLDSVLRGFGNVCRHNGTPVADGSGQLTKFVCPYHGWEYDLTGALLSAPRIGGIKGFQREQYHLSEFQVLEVGPLVFANIAGTAKEIELSELTKRLGESRWDTLVRRERRSYALQCNWKVFLDNYLDGGYHVPFLHPTLAKNLNLGAYKTELFGGYSIQSVSPSAEATERLSAEALYAWVYPNLMINRYGPMMDVNVVFPTGPESCRVVFDWYFDKSAPKSFIDQALTDSERVQNEDIQICERVQRGMASMHFSPGPYAPKVEHGKHHFHHLIAQDVGE
jgi:choline monooxygenase